MNIREATKLQDLFLQIEDEEAKDAMLVILTKLASKNKIPDNLSIFDMEIQQMKDSGFTEDSKSLDDFTEEKEIPLLSKEEQEDIEAFDNTINQEDFNNEKNKGDTSVITGPYRLLGNLGIKKAFLKKYKRNSYSLALTLYNEILSTYIKPSLNKKTIALWQEIDEHAGRLGYNKETYTPRLRYAITYLDNKGYLKDLINE